MKVEAIPSGPFDTNAYIVEDDNKVFIVDPAPGSCEPILAKIASFDVVAIVLTHTHWDHIADVAILKKKLKVPVWVHQEDAPNLRNPGSDQLPLFFSIEPAEVDDYLEEGVPLQLGKKSFSVIHTPGHSPGSVCLYCEEAGVLLSGDTLFKGTIGNISFPHSSATKMWESLKKLETLPPSTVVYPGHGEATTLQQESWLPQAKVLFGGDHG